MATFDLPLDQIDAVGLAAFVADAAREGRQLEYKEQLPGGTDDDKREFLSDATFLPTPLGATSCTASGNAGTRRGTLRASPRRSSASQD
jgi:hypothetical protein